MSLKMNLNIFFTIGFFEKSQRREESFFFKTRIPSSLEDDHTCTNYTRSHLLVLRVKLPPGGS